ncbi:MAG: oxidoreductase-like domain-containing protein [Limnohabitans sp.]
MSDIHALHDPGLAMRQAVREHIAHMQQRLQTAGHGFRNPPPEPTTCCGRGCNGCVWEGYDAALAWWLQEAQALLAKAQPPSATTAPEGSNGTSEST